MSVYLDNAATTRPWDTVVSRMAEGMGDHYYNPSAAYAPAVGVEKQIAACAQGLRDSLFAQGYQVVFTAGGTEADALAILGTVGLSARPQRIAITSVEHPAVQGCGLLLQQQGHEVVWLPVDSQGLVDLRACAELLDERIGLISVMQVNNETGAVQPIAEVARLRSAKCSQARLHVDGVQGFLRVPLALGRDGVDLYTLSAHKIHGPKGVGALLVKKGLRLSPLYPGGGQQGGLRSGTENTPGIYGLAAALEAWGNSSAAARDMCDLKLRLWQGLCGISGAAVNGPDPSCPQSAPHILNVSFTGLRGEVLLHALEAQGIYVSTGSACSAKGQRVSRVLEAMGLPRPRLEGALRFSLSPDNTPAQMDEAVAACRKAVEQLSGFRRR